MPGSLSHIVRVPGRSSNLVWDDIYILLSANSISTTRDILILRCYSSGASDITLPHSRRPLSFLYDFGAPEVIGWDIQLL